ncbi:hypothetical protein D3C80_1612410 [compost metagenome]
MLSSVRSISATSRVATVFCCVSITHTWVLPSRSSKALRGNSLRGVTCELRVTLMAVPRWKAAGVLARVRRARRVRVVASAWGSNSRRLAVVLMVGSSCKATVKVRPLLNCSARPIGRSITASFTSGRARVTTAWPAVTVCPASACQAVITAAWSVRRVL